MDQILDPSVLLAAAGRIGKVGKEAEWQFFGGMFFSCHNVGKQTKKSHHYIFCHSYLILILAKKIRFENPVGHFNLIFNHCGTCQYFSPFYRCQKSCEKTWLTKESSSESNGFHFCFLKKNEQEVWPKIGVLLWSKVHFSFLSREGTRQNHGVLCFDSSCCGGTW